VRSLLKLVFLLAYVLVILTISAQSHASVWGPSSKEECLKKYLPKAKTYWVTSLYGDSCRKLHEPKQGETVEDKKHAKCILNSNEIENAENDLAVGMLFRDAGLCKEYKISNNTSTTTKPWKDFQKMRLKKTDSYLPRDLFLENGIFPYNYNLDDLASDDKFINLSAYCQGIFTWGAGYYAINKNRPLANTLLMKRAQILAALAIKYSQSDMGSRITKELEDRTRNAKSDLDQRPDLFIRYSDTCEKYQSAIIDSVPKNKKLWGKTYDEIWMMYNTPQKLDQYLR
jgi:hypothetical protein